MLPIIKKTRPSFASYMPFVFSGFWLIMTFVVFHSNAVTEIWIYALLIIPPIIIVRLALKGLKTIDVRIDTDYVSYNSKSPFKKESWKIKTSEYLGVLRTIEERSSGSDNHSNTYHILRLKHVDEEYDMYLHQSLFEKGIREIQENYCKELNLPALFVNSNGEYDKREVEELDKTIQNQLNEGSLRATNVHVFKFNKRIQYKELSDGFYLKSYSSTSHWKWLGLLMVLGGVSIFVFASEGFVPAVLLLLMGTYIFVINFQTTEIKASKGWIAIELSILGKQVRRYNFSISEIEEIKLTKESNNSRERFLILSDRLQANLYLQLNHKEEELLKSRMLRHIKEGS